MNSNTSVFLGIILLIILIAFGPLVTIWSLNILFPLLAIQYNFATWFAIIWIGAFFKTTVKTK